MAIVKVVEVIAQSEKNWEDATKQALKEVSKTVRDIKSIYVQDLQAIVDKNKITQYRLCAKISFVVDR